MAQDKKKGHNFFGLEHYPNTKPGVGDGTGTQLWLCPKCYEGLSRYNDGAEHAELRAKSAAGTAAAASAANADHLQAPNIDFDRVNSFETAV